MVIKSPVLFNIKTWAFRIVRSFGYLKYFDWSKYEKENIKHGDNDVRNKYEVKNKKYIISINPWWKIIANDRKNIQSHETKNDKTVELQAPGVVGRHSKISNKMCFKVWIRYLDKRAYLKVHQMSKLKMLNQINEHWNPRASITITMSFSGNAWISILLIAKEIWMTQSDDTKNKTHLSDWVFNTLKNA